jgi:hypothetical protein
MSVSFSALPQPPHYNRSIFTHVLVTLIGQKTNSNDEIACLNKLYALRRKDLEGGAPSQDLVASITIKRLIQSLHSAQYRRTLNREQMRAIVEHFHLASDERILLYASLIAMLPQSQLVLFEVPVEEAWKVVSLIGDRAIEWLQRDDSFMRQAEDNLEGTADDILVAALTPALDAYDEGIELAFGARYLPDYAGRSNWYQLALFHFAHATELLDGLSDSVKQSAEWRQWRMMVQQEIVALLQRNMRLPEVRAWP